MVYDFDDAHEGNDALPRLRLLKEINPAFRCTLFAVPKLGSDEFWDSHPDWVELAVHGRWHHSPYECADWSKSETLHALDEKPTRFVEGWKSPGWQTSDGVYAALLERGWFIADQHLEDRRRPHGLRTYFYEDGGWHGHVQNVCGNGLEETWAGLTALVEKTERFEFASEALT